ncbi:MAG TPA: type II toxin-antitoxin system Phd/YefM family antitoxin [Kofleriaceae bacterium]
MGRNAGAGACHASSVADPGRAITRRGKLATYHDSDRLTAMPVIKPISDLRNRAKELSRLCHDTGEPIFITRNGEGDMVLMSLAAYDRLQARLELYRMLDEAESDVAAGDRGVSVAAVRRQLKR